MIKDSGNRTEFASGAVRDMRTGKGRFDLMPMYSLLKVSRHCENGAIKYGERNVNKGVPLSSLCDSAMRHLSKYILGLDDEDHLVACAWNVLWAIEMEQKKEMIDIPERKNKNKFKYYTEKNND